MIRETRAMLNLTRHQDDGCRAPNHLTTWLMLLLTMGLSATAQLHNGSTANTEITYADVHKLMPNCHPNDTCSVARDVDDTVQPVPYFCHCAEYCTRFGTCCVDSPYRHVAPDLQLTPHSCVQVYQNRSQKVFMIDRCKGNWDDEYVQEKCLGDGDKRSDSMLLIPVTNKRSGITYKNFFCAVCNGNDRTSDLVFWHMGVFLDRVVNSTRSGRLTRLELKRLRYRRGNDGTKRWLPSASEGTLGVTRVWFELDIPSSVAHHVKSCRKHVTTCAADWTDDVTRAKCGSYMAMVGARFGPPNEWGNSYKRYRNIHCAICNRVPQNLLECVVNSGSDPGSQGRTPYDIGMLVDINRPDGGRCLTGQIYDPIKQTCIRSAGCSAGYVMRGNECVLATSG